jgi:hypothetical protein
VLTVVIRGVDEAMLRLGLVADGAMAASRTRVLVGTDLPYAYGIETGYRHSGRLARRAGGLYYLTGAADALRPSITPRLAGVLQDGPAAVAGELLAIGMDVAGQAQERETAVVSGSLRRSIHAERA